MGSISQDYFITVSALNPDESFNKDFRFYYVAQMFLEYKNWSGGDWSLSIEM